MKQAQNILLKSYIQQSSKLAGGNKGDHFLETTQKLNSTIKTAIKTKKPVVEDTNQSTNSVKQGSVGQKGTTATVKAKTPGKVNGKTKKTKEEDPYSDRLGDFDFYVTS